MSQSDNSPQLNRIAMEDLLLLTEVEQADLLASLREAEVAIEAGRYIENDPDTFVDRFLAIHNAAMR